MTTRVAPPPVSATDLAILGCLLTDARQSFRRIAKKLDLSVVTVAHHVRAMEERGVLRGYRAEVDFEKLGYQFQIITAVKVEHGKLFDVERRIAADPHVWAVYDHTGGTDATVLARFQDRASLDQFIKRIQSIPHVERTETNLVLNVIKESAKTLSGVA
jgi:DNA-binding Lrp family transcriptional regulator